MEIRSIFLVGSHASCSISTDRFVEGFSRGAYQARVIAGMIHRVGHLGVLNQMTIDVSLGRFDSPRQQRTDTIVSKCCLAFERHYILLILSTFSAFELYSTIEEKVPKAKVSRHKHVMANDLAETFKTTFCRPHVHVHFIGVWYALTFRACCLFVHSCQGIPFLRSAL